MLIIFLVAVLSREELIWNLYDEIMKIDDTVEHYWDPQIVTTLPWPSISNAPNRFSIHSAGEIGTFDYMGRVKFKEIYTDFRALGEKKHQAKSLFVYGTMGYGKSHILTAIACVLTRRGHRVVYIPDCAGMLEDLETVIKESVLMAFGRDDALDKQIREEIMYMSFEELERWLQDYPGTLWYIVDQMNALDFTSPDTFPQSLKFRFIEFFHKVKLRQPHLTSASANYVEGQNRAGKQNARKRINLFGGLTQVRNTTLSTLLELIDMCRKKFMDGGSTMQESKRSLVTGQPKLKT